MNRSFAVLLLSCDKYSDMWPHFMRQFRINFPAGDYPIYVGSNEIPCVEPGVVPVLSGKDVDWSSSLKKILGQINEDHLLVILEDLLISSPVDKALLDASIKFMQERKVFHIKYWVNPPFDEPSDHPLFGVYAKGAPYRATVCGFWHRSYLLGLLIEGENPWNFEILGSYRTAYSDGFYCLVRPLCEFRNMIEKGNWIPESITWADENGIKVDLGKRPILQGKNQLISRLQMLYFKLMLKVPWRKRVALMNLLRKAFISY